MKNYNTARNFIGVMEVIGWLIVVISFIALISSFGRGGMSAFIFAFPIAVTGLALVTVVQITRAQIDTAENTGRILALVEANIRQQGDRATHQPKPTAKTEDVVKIYRGEPITRAANGFIALGEHYYGVMAAERAIDESLDRK